MKKNMYRIRFFALILASILVFCLMVPSLFSSVAEGTIPYARKDMEPYVRVYLSRLNLTDRLDITLTTPYGLSFGNAEMEMYLESGSELAFLIKNENIYLYMDGMSMRLGDSVTLRRYADSQPINGDKPGFFRTGFEPLYLGDLSLTINGGRLYPVLKMHVEDYLLGVVPYEMSDSFPVEALKAQTIAARTYVLRKVNPSKAYDVVDTTNDQVFKGYVPGFAQTEKAVSDTWGICGFYKGKLAQCYYSASNGGQTELVQTVWPTNEDYGYYAFGKDPYDVENPASTVRSFRMEKKYSEQQTAPYGLRKLLADVLAEELIALGYDPAPESIRIHQVSDVSMDTPSARDSLLLTQLHMTVSISGRTRQEGTSIVDDDEEVFLFETPAPATPAPTTAEASSTPEPTSTPEPVYGSFERIEEAFELHLPVFGKAENAFALNISGNFDNEIWTLLEDAHSYTLEARRYGHGVGMSQRGAEWMAGNYEKDFVEILEFYYPGMALQRFSYAGLELPRPEEALSATAGPAPTVTPRPTLMPLTGTPNPGQWIAVVTEISEDSSLNLRSQPNLSSDILMRLYKNQRLLVLERCPEEGWVHVQTDSVSGYVMESYLTIE